MISDNYKRIFKTIGIPPLPIMSYMDIVRALAQV